MAGPKCLGLKTAGFVVGAVVGAFSKLRERVSTLIMRVSAGNTRATKAPDGAIFFARKTFLADC